MNNLISLSKLFDKRIFRIPDYQRGYAWQLPQLSDFWDDLWNLSEDRYHYTGMLSLKKLKSDIYKNWTEEKWLIYQNDYEAFHVVDGQQRLTTFIILVNSIVNLAEKQGIEYLNNNELSEIKTRYMESRWGVRFKDEDMKYSVLGLSFMKDGREIPDELPEEDSNSVSEADVAADMDTLRLGYWTSALPVIREAHGPKIVFLHHNLLNRIWCIQTERKHNQNKSKQPY